MIKTQLNKNLYTIILGVTVLYIIQAVFFTAILQYDFMKSDVQGYWQDSLNWLEPFHKFHVPLYPLLITFLRTIFIDTLPPVLVMMLINLSALIISCLMVFLIVTKYSGENVYGYFSVILFVLWPFVGLNYTVMPLADIPATMFFLVGVFFIQKSKTNLAAMCFGLAMVTHKAMWFFVAMGYYFLIVRASEHNLKDKFIFGIITVTPLTFLWAAGSFFHQSIFWILTSNLSYEVTSKGALPILDGLLGTFQNIGIISAIKGLLLWFFFFFTLVVFILSIKRNILYYEFGIAVSIPVLFLFFVLNQHEIWAAVRYSRLLSIPLALIMFRFVKITTFKILYGKVCITIMVTILLLSQFAYGWYIAKIFFV